MKTYMFDKRAIANLATIMPNGSQVTPVWIDFDGKNRLVNTAIGQVKDKNMRSKKKVAISIQDPENPYRYMDFIQDKARECGLVPT